MKPVSAETERRLREALTQLMAADERLSVANLARRAGVSRATANRAVAIRSELREAEAGRQGAAPAPVDNDEQSRAASENILAQHAQLRALLRGEERRRNADIGNVIPILRR
ncbi:HTH domain-containing protein [Stakelama sediminis]|nr:HTH domain-containing protein [Stakelama sediminis]